MDSIYNDALKSFDIQINELEKAKSRIDKEEFMKIVNEILQIKGKVVVTGIGKSGMIGRKIASTLASTGTEAIFINSAESLHGDLGMVSSKDIVIILSSSGNSDEIVNMLPVLKKIGVKIIGMTGNKNSKLGKSSDYIIDTRIDKEACPMGLAPMSSTTVSLVLGDMLAVALIKAKDFKPENFALYHPAGSLGRRLLLKVEDLMHKDEKIAKIMKTADIEEVILEMSSKNLGAVCIVDNNNNLEGIITEGDLRRALKHKDKFFDYKALDIMTKNPRTIDKDMLAIDALDEMEKGNSQITVIPVLEDKKLIGMIRIHDLLKVL